MEVSAPPSAAYLKYLFTASAICGYSTELVCARSGATSSPSCLRVYSAVMAAVSWLNVAAQLYKFVYIDAFSALWYFWWLQVLLQLQVAIAHASGMANSSKIAKFLADWSAAYDGDASAPSDHHPRLRVPYMNTLQKLSACSIITFAMVAMGYLVYYVLLATYMRSATLCLLSINGSSSNSGWSYCANDSGERPVGFKLAVMTVMPVAVAGREIWPLHFVALVVTLWQSVQFWVNSLRYVNLTAIAYNELRTFNDFLEKAVSPQGTIPQVTTAFFYRVPAASCGSTTGYKEDAPLESWRRGYIQTLDLVETLDDIFSPYIGLNFALSIVSFCACIFLKEDIKVVANAAETVTETMVALTAAASFLAVLVPALLISSEAHRPDKVIGQLSVTNLDESQRCSATMFLLKLQTSEHGLTCLKMFTVNRTSVLTLFGTLVTYVIVVIQFKGGM